MTRKTKPQSRHKARLRKQARRAARCPESVIVQRDLTLIAWLFWMFVAAVVGIVSWLAWRR